MKRIKAIITGIFISLTAVLLVECGKSTSENSKQILNLSTTRPLDTIDISKSTGYGQTGNVFESCYRIDEDGKVNTGIAKSGQVSQDGTTWTFTLRDAKWINGDTITAQDFGYTWKR